MKQIGTGMTRFKTTCLCLLATVLAAGCGSDTPPVTSGTVNVSSALNAIDASWTPAADDSTAQADLQYQVMYSTSNNLSTVANALVNGTVATAWTKNISSATISNLQYSTPYYVAVLVQDGSQNRSIYPVATVTTEASTALSNGGQVTCPAGQVMNGFGGRKGAIIDQIFLQCVPANTLTQAAANKGPGIGSTGGTEFATFMCPDGSAVTSLAGGNSGAGFSTALSSLQVTCSDNGPTTSTINFQNVGDIPYTFSCPAGRLAIGIDADPTQGGAYAGFIKGIVCENAPS